MKRKIFICFCLICLRGDVFSQDTALYLQFKTIPLFNIIKVPDSTTFTKADLPKKKAVLVMIFSPDCEHCQHEVEELKANYSLFKKVNILMASPIEFKYIKKFYEDYQIADYPKITMGRDPNYMLGTFYKVRSFPALFLYDKKGNFVKAFDGKTPITQIAASL